jgi:hypothetical protein
MFKFIFNMKIRSFVHARRALLHRNQIVGRAAGVFLTAYYVELEIMGQKLVFGSKTGFCF